MKAIYTDAAQRELELFKANQQFMLEELVAERKLVFGEDVLEITASDIKEAAHRIRPLRPTIRRTQTTELVTKAYIVIGVVMMIGAFFYPQIQAILVENRIQALIFLMGATMAALGWILSYWLSVRKKRLLEAERFLEGLELKESRLRSRDEA